jgi:hypothetical protein
MLFVELLLHGDAKVLLNRLRLGKRATYYRLMRRQSSCEKRLTPQSKFVKVRLKGGGHGACMEAGAIHSS